VTATEIRIRRRRVRLLPERAIAWPAQRLVAVADTHFGKGECFRARGIPIPPGTSTADLERLDAAIARTRPRTLIVLGDFFHAPPAALPHTVGRLQKWRGGHPDLELVLVSGNHDRRAEAAAAAIGIDLQVDAYERDGILFVHNAPDRNDRYVVSGHLHPAVRLRGPAHTVEDAACFWVRPDRTVLPAFGGFTGCARVRPAPGDRVFVIADGRVLEVACA
jgi:DNA ligase-associated metallophosphoesterase